MGPGIKHFGDVKGDTILQLHGTRPWAGEYVDPKDDPERKSNLLLVGPLLIYSLKS
jgi:hypothetical protein